MKRKTNRIDIKEEGDTVTFDVDVEWRVLKSENDSVWVATCEELGLATEDASLDELYSAVDDTMELLLGSLERAGDWDEFLRERGWACSRKINIPNPRFIIPWHVRVPSGQNDPISSAA